MRIVLEGILCFGLNKMNWKIVSTKMAKEVPMLVRNEDIDIGTSDVPNIDTFQRS